MCGVAFSEKPEITALLKNTDQPDLTETVQLLTEEYSRSIADAEGLGICDNNTRFLAHTNKMVVGMQTRAEANRLEQFHDALLDAGDQVLDCGIILSPTQHEPVLSLYKAIKDENGNLLGNTSLGVYAKSFIENPSPALKGAEDASYTLVSAETAKYLLHSDETLVGGDVQNDRLLDLCSVLSTGNGDLTGSFEYTADHKTHLASYQYMPEYGCILLLDATV